jgi:hypothetical protein
VNRVSKFTGDGTFITTWGAYGSGPGFFITPLGLAVDSNNDVYVIDHHNFRIQKFTSDGVFLGMWGEHGEGPGEISDSHGMAIDSRDNLYFLSHTSEPMEGYVQKYVHRPSAVHAATWGRVKTLYR